MERAAWLAGSCRPLRPSRFRPCPEARAFVHALGLRSFAAWRQWARSPQRPPDIPSNPDQVYARAGWQDWYDWLGKPRPAFSGRFRPFAAARAWRRWAASPARPADIPSNPDRAYAQAGWTDWADWLGTEHPRGGRPADQGPAEQLSRARPESRGVRMIGRRPLI